MPTIIPSHRGRKMDGCFHRLAGQLGRRRSAWEGATIEIQHQDYPIRAPPYRSGKWFERPRAISGFGTKRACRGVHAMSALKRILLQKSFWGGERKFLEPLMRFTRGDVRDPYRFIQNRSRTSLVALKSDAAAERSTDQLSRDFLGCSIFDFCNNIGTKRTCRGGLTMSALGGGTD